MAVPRLLIVSDDGSTSSAMARTLGSLGYQMFTADDPAGASDLFEANRYSLVIVESRQDTVSALNLIGRLQEQQADVACILVANDLDRKVLDAAGSDTIRRCLSRPVDPDELIDAVEEVLCRDSSKFDQKYPDAESSVAALEHMAKRDRPSWCEVCGYNTHWYHRSYMRNICSESCLEQYQRSASSK